MADWGVAAPLCIMTKNKPKKNKSAAPLPPMAEDRHVLYSAAVQATSADLGFAERVYRKKRGHLPRDLREDFCGTALLSADWVKRRKGNQAWGVDLDRDTLAWGQQYCVDPLGDDARRVHLLCENVLEASTPPVDLTLALNFSYFIFKSRRALKQHLASAYQALKADGVFVMDIYGGSSAPTACREERHVHDGVTPEGGALPRFKFVWEHETYNAITGELKAHIHFKHKGHPWMRKAFSYDWRFWTLPEVREVLAEVGFASTDVFSHGWDKNGENDGIYRRRAKIVNEEGWIGYIAAYK